MLLMCCLLHKPSSPSLTQPRTPCCSLLVSGVAFRWMQRWLIRFSELQVPDGANVSELRKLGVYCRRLLKSGMEAMLVRLLSSQNMLGLILMMSSSAHFNWALFSGCLHVHLSSPTCPCFLCTLFSVAAQLAESFLCFLPVSPTITLSESGTST